MSEGSHGNSIGLTISHFHVIPARNVINLQDLVWKYIIWLSYCPKQYTSGRLETRWYRRDTLSEDESRLLLIKYSRWWRHRSKRIPKMDWQEVHGTRLCSLVDTPVLVSWRFFRYHISVEHLYQRQVRADNHRWPVRCHSRCSISMSAWLMVLGIYKLELDCSFSASWWASSYS
jgi:hypothetical protein